LCSKTNQEKKATVAKLLSLFSLHCNKTKKKGDNNIAAVAFFVALQKKEKGNDNFIAIAFCAPKQTKKRRRQ